MKIFFLLSFILIFAPKQIFGQESSRIISEFVSNLRLTTITNNDSIKLIGQEIDFILKNRTHRIDRKILFNFFDNWKLTHCTRKGYRETFPEQYNDTTGFAQIHRHGVTLFHTPKNGVSVISGFELFKIFGISKGRFPINYIPLVYERGSRFEGEWTAISLNKEYLIIRYVSSYPDGNLTSWYQEEVFYFRRDKTSK